MASRNYPSGVVEALISWSHGSCYWPDCGQPVIVVVKKLPQVNLDIAHIAAVSEGGPRFDDKMSLRERNSFENLMLMCRPHHKHIDRMPVHKDYGVDTLKTWKKKAEPKNRQELDFLELDDDGLQKLISEVIEQHAAEVKSALEQLKEQGNEHTGLLHKILGRFDDVQLAGNYADADNATMLNNAGRNLATYLDPDVVLMLSEGARGLTGLDPDLVWALKESTDSVGQVADLANTMVSLRRLLESPALVNLPDIVSHLERVIERMPRDY